MQIHDEDAVETQSNAGLVVLQTTTNQESVAFSHDAVAVIGRKRREFKREGRMAEFELWGFVQVLVAKVIACFC